MSNKKDRPWLAFFFLTAVLYGLVSFTQLDVDFTRWSVVARSILIVGILAIGALMIWLNDPPTS